MGGTENRVFHSVRHVGSLEIYGSPMNTGCCVDYWVEVGKPMFFF